VVQPIYFTEETFVNKAKKRKTRKFLPAKSSSFKVFILGRNEISSASRLYGVAKIFYLILE